VCVVLCLLLSFSYTVLKHIFQICLIALLGFYKVMGNGDERKDSFRRGESMAWNGVEVVEKRNFLLFAPRRVL
jgi:hypothetical protein